MSVDSARRGSGQLSILLFADDQKGHANTVHEHIRAFRRHSRHRITVFNPRGLRSSRFLELTAFDVVVIHYSLIVTSDDYLAPWFRDRIADYDGLKVQFLQDEYRQVDEITAMLRYLGIDILYSAVPPQVIDGVYGPRLPNTRVVPTLTGYVADDLVGRRVPPTAARPIDVGYRGRSVPFWLGRLGYEKVEIGRGFLEHCAGLSLRCDIAWTEGARIYGTAWNTFVSSCRAMLASESGASIFDVDGSAERAVCAYVADHPTARYEQVELDVLGRWLDGPKLNAVSPRVFEAAASRTALVMFPGEYSGVARPLEHYIPLEKDFSNIAEVAERVLDTAFVDELTRRTYGDLIDSGVYSYSTFIRQFDELVAEVATRPRPRAAPTVALRLEELAAGRGYYTSGVYGFAREAVLAAVGARHLLARRPLQRLASRALLEGRRSALWGDAIRLAILVAVRDGALVPTNGAFGVSTALTPDGRLTITSTEAGTTVVEATREALALAIRGGELTEVVWNHAPVGQYVGLSLRPSKKRLFFDVGRYDSYGVYRFNAVVNLARTDPELAIAVLELLLPPMALSSNAPAAYRVAAGQADPDATESHDSRTRRESKP